MNLSERWEATGNPVGKGGNASVVEVVDIQGADSREIDQVLRVGVTR